MDVHGTGENAEAVKTVKNEATDTVAPPTNSSAPTPNGGQPGNADGRAALLEMLDAHLIEMRAAGLEVYRGIDNRRRLVIILAGCTVDGAGNSVEHFVERAA